MQRRPHLLGAPNIAGDPLKNQLQFRSVTNFVVNKLDLAFAGPAMGWTLFCHPWSLGAQER